MLWSLRDIYYLVSDYLARGGVVMMPLMIVSVVMWALIINRVLFFRRLYRRNMKWPIALDHVRNNRIPDRSRYRGIISVLVTEFLKRKSGERQLDRYILDETVVWLVSATDRYLAIIGVLAGIAPLMGLLGTVTGMIATFDSIAIFGTGNTRAMAGGISEALITTQTGLLVAIPGVYMKNFLVRRSEKLKQRAASLGMYLRRQL
jgi:biopolymer transport protein ExbB